MFQNIEHAYQVEVLVMKRDFIRAIASPDVVKIVCFICGNCPCVCIHLKGTDLSKLRQHLEVATGATTDFKDFGALRKFQALYHSRKNGSSTRKPPMPGLGFCHFEISCRVHCFIP